MNFSSRLFDRIRIGPSEAEEVVEAEREKLVEYNEQQAKLSAALTRVRDAG